MLSNRNIGASFIVLASLLTSACSIKKMAVNALGNALAGGASVYATDDDPELVGDAVPFGLKTIEGLLEESPRHEQLLLAACSGFVQYAFVWVQQEADYIESNDLARATEMRRRAVRLYLRGRDYGLRGLDVDFPGFLKRLGDEPDASIRRIKLEKRHVPLLYWTGMAWFGAIALDKSNSELSADQHVAVSLMKEALRLDESFERGSIHDFFIAWEARGASLGGSNEKARGHFARALELADGQRVLPFVILAENVAVTLQDRPEFETLLERGLSVDCGRLRSFRLNNVVAQKRARWLLNRKDELFVE